MTPDSGTVWTATSVPDGAGGVVPVRVIRPMSAVVGWLVWAHGGSWSGGSAAGWHHACADLAVRANCVVASVDYRLAPRHPHPAALLDVLVVLGWAQTQARAEGAGQVAVGGDSAGATIAACAALVWRDQRRALHAQALAYPPIDPDCRGASYFRYPQLYPRRANLMQSWRAYRGAGDRALTGPALYSTPMEAVDLVGVAPAILAVGDRDPVVDDVLGYAARLSAAGVEVSARRFPDTRHGAFLEWCTGSGADAGVRAGAADGHDSLPIANPLRVWLASRLRAAFLRPGSAGPAGSAGPDAELQRCTDDGGNHG